MTHENTRDQRTHTRLPLPFVRDSPRSIVLLVSAVSLTTRDRVVLSKQLFLVYGLPIHFVIAWIAIRGFFVLLIPIIRDGRASSDWIVLLVGGVFALAGASPLLIFAWIILAG